MVVRVTASAVVHAQECPAALGPALTQVKGNQNHISITRQQALISHAIRHPGFIYNIAGHPTGGEQPVASGAAC